MRSCPEFKALIDAGGGREEGDAADLVAHLPICASCSEYKALADQTRKLLGELGKRLRAVDPIEGAFQRLSARVKSSRRQMSWLLVLLAACITAPFAMTLRGALPPVVWGSLLLTAAATGAGVWRIARGQSRLARIQKGAEALFEDWKRDVERRIRATAIGAAFSGALCIGLISIAVLGSFATGQRFVVLSVAFLLAFGSLHALFVELRDLKSELQCVRTADHD